MCSRGHESDGTFRQGSIVSILAYIEHPHNEYTTYTTELLFDIDVDYLDVFVRLIQLIRLHIFDGVDDF